MIGFSTGALTLGDYRHALRILADKEVNAVELSALRQEELKPLVEGLENLDLRKFQYIAFHAPSSLEPSFEGTALELLEQVAGVSIERARYRKEPTLIGDPTDDPADRYARQKRHAFRGAVPKAGGLCPAQHGRPRHRLEFG